MIVTVINAVVATTRCLKKKNKKKKMKKKKKFTCFSQPTSMIACAQLRDNDASRGEGAPADP